MGAGPVVLERVLQLVLPCGPACFSPPPPHTRKVARPRCPWPPSCWCQSSSWCPQPIRPSALDSTGSSQAWGSGAGQAEWPALVTT